MKYGTQKMKSISHGRGKMKSTESTKRRLKSRLGDKLNEDDFELIFHMIDSLIINRDNVVEHLKKKLNHYDKPRLIEEKVIKGAIKDTINSHGPITRELLGSAAKRIQAQLRNHEKGNSNINLS